MIPENEVEALEKELDAFDPAVRENAIQEIADLCRVQRVRLAPESLQHNLHCHTFYSYNGYGYSPEHIAWLAKKNGWFAAGSVDFDVLSAVDEFRRAATLLDVRNASGMESRVFVREWADREINSPGEPGVAYHLGLGFISSCPPEKARPFAEAMRRSANERTRGIVERVNGVLSPLELDFSTDVLPLTPEGNATERHVCCAYRIKLEQLQSDPAVRTAFWAEKLGLPPEKAATVVADPVALEGAIRSKLMKRGGVGYVEPTPDSFPPLEDFNAFILGCGAIPAVAWLNGLSAGESDPAALLDLHVAKGAAMLNVIPDRNWNFPDPEKRRRHAAELDRLLTECRRRDLPVVIGTEMNAPGQKLADDLGVSELAKHSELFVDGAAILAAHSLLATLGRGYLSDWARHSFASTAAKNDFFTKFGRLASPVRFVEVNVWPDDPAAMLLRVDR
ncbi:MAG: hypothetical protein PHI35_01360 [Victivallaceae bacterium]|nr:hypothetical protein [Victivallaceae bacterium]